LKDQIEGELYRRKVVSRDFREEIRPGVLRDNPSEELINLLAAQFIFADGSNRLIPAYHLLGVYS